MEAEELLDWIESNCIRTASGCLEFTKRKNPCGYCQLRFRGGIRTVHRIVMCVLYEVDINTPKHVLHSCDNPACCWPYHLRFGTHQDNMDDKKSRGRAANVVTRDTSPNTKLSSEDYKKLSIELSERKLSRAELAVKYNISSTLLSVISIRETGNRQRVGGTNSQAKLTDEKVLRIIEDIKEEKKSLAFIALEYNVSETTISNIKHNRTWKHVAR